MAVGPGPDAGPTADPDVAPDPGGAIATSGRSNRLLGPALITLVLIAGQLSFGMLESYVQTGLAVLAACVSEALLGRLRRGTWPHLGSAYITGISIGILVRSLALWPYVVGAALSITSKYVLRWRGRHLWNPSNFGLCMLLLLAPYVVAPLSIQWGNSLWPIAVVWVIGATTLWRLGRLHVSLTYVVSFLILAGWRSALTGARFLAEVAPITGSMYQLFILFMITDPKTTVRSVRGRCTVAALVAVVEALLRLAEVVYAPFYALFLVGPVALLVEMERPRTRRRQSSRAVAAS